MKKEDKIQQECIMWFNNNYTIKGLGLMFSVPNSGKSAKEQMYKKAVGMMPGVADTILLLKNTAFFVEFKTENGKQSENQIKFQRRVDELGFEYKIIKSYEEFKQYIASLLRG